MYVCICNAFTDKDVDQALSDGARTLPDVFRAMGCQPNCGRCCTHMRGMIRKHHEDKQEPLPLIAAE